ncbi:MAG TPA: diguanylate cyclase [Burkholderiales bacterium]|nr:diguanylate cyclase [Burkholderiales bacterium]
MNASSRFPPPSDAFWKSLAESTHDLLWAVDGEGRWTYLSPAAARRIYGEEAQALLGTALAARSAEEAREPDARMVARALAGEPVMRHETRHRRADGSKVALSFNAVPLRDDSGAVTGVTGTARDISEERAAADALAETVERLRLAVDAAELTYWEWDRDSDRLHWGRQPLGGAGGEEGHSARWTEYREQVHPEDRERYLAKIAAAWESGAACTNEYRVISRDGREVWIASRGKTVLDASGRPTRMIGVSQDITERKRREAEDRFLAHHDSLTGLPNRRLLDDRLRQALHLAQRRDARVAVMLVDLDDFKQVNDRFGHNTGDAVLREVAQRLSGCMRKSDTLARQGGDEFVVVIPELANEADCEVVAEKILRALEPPVPVEGDEVHLGASIGVSLYPADARDGETLLRNADAAMYRAKQAGGHRFLHYGR